MKNNPQIIRFTLSLLRATAFPVVSALMINLMGAMLNIKNVEAQEWPPLKKNGNGCAEIQGTFQNSGEDAPLNKRGSRSPPRLSFDALSSGWPGRNIVQVKIETLGNTILRFWFIDQSGEISEAQEFESICQNGWWTFNRAASVSAGEGWHGTQTTFIQLAIAADGSLLAHVVRDRKGKDFYLFPRESSEEFEYRFLKTRSARSA